MSLLIIGGTGTLGRQIVLQALTKGYPVRCLVRNFQTANFLRNWGVELVYGDLTKPETIPPSLKGITAIIDVSTSRANDLNSLKKVDWNGKLSLIKAAQAANIKKFIFFSAQNAEQLENIPLMKLKHGVELELKTSKIPYTIFRLTGFYQGLIDQYAIPILENLPIWLTNEKACLAYMDTQDIAKFCIRALQIPATNYQTFTLMGLKGWISSEIISLCEQLAGQTANLRVVPLFVLEITSKLFGFFEWGQNICDRLAFAKILTLETPLEASSQKLYSQFKIDSSELIPLDDYFLEYFIRLLKRLRDINFEDIQKQKNLII